MKTRIITGIILVLVLIPLLIFSDSPVFAGVVTLVGCVGAWEMLHCIGTNKKWLAAIPSYLYVIVVTVAAKVMFLDVLVEKLNVTRDYFAWTYIGATFFYFVVLAVYAIFSKGKFSVENMFATFGGVFYVGSAFSALTLISVGYGGKFLLILPLLIPIISDTFAYFTGVFFGKHKLIPDVSPKKTVEGSIGGIVFAGAACVLYVVVLLNYFENKNDVQYNVELWHYIGVFFAGALVALLSQIGDLFASLIKRKYGIKDYGKLFPGHGGVLDRLDSVLITSPLILLFSFILQFIDVH